MKNTFVCFYGDGDLWKNINEVVSYPSGCSFYRDFRYPDNRIQNEILEEIKHDEQRILYQGRKALLSIRFFNENFKWLLLPIREIEITKIKYMADNHSVFFKLGKMVDFCQTKKLRDYCIEIPLSERDHITNDNILLRSSASIDKIKFSKIENEDDSWVAYTTKVVKDTSVPFNDGARNSLFLRLSCLPNEKCVSVDNLYDSINKGQISGLKFKEGKNYEIGILHRAPSLIGTNTTIGQQEVEYIYNQTTLELNCSVESYSANYQTHIIFVSAKNKTGTFEEIQIKPKSQEIKISNNKTLNAYELKVPFRVFVNHWHRFKNSYIWLILLFIALLILSDPFSTFSLSINPLVKLIFTGIASLIIVYFNKKD
jgi:hypothetical protein